MSNPTSQTEQKANSAGLAGVVALESGICDIDGLVGTLVYSGYDIDDLARNSSFEAVLFLLWNGALPTDAQLSDLGVSLSRERTLPPSVMDILEGAPESAPPMAVLRTAVSALGYADSEADDGRQEANQRKAVRLAARLPTLVAALARIREGRVPVSPVPELDTASNFLYMLHGERAGPAAERIFDACLVLHAEHGLNASTFAARVIGATLADMYGAVAGAMGALKGPLHGGANLKVKEMLDAIKASGTSPEHFVAEKLRRKERIMGFGHRVYKTIDPRATILKEMLAGLSSERGDDSWLRISTALMATMEKEKNLHPNVDFFSASVYALLGIDDSLFTPIFAMSRIAGWTAHLMEQWVDNRLIRPRSAYVGPAPRRIR